MVVAPPVPVMAPPVANELVPSVPLAQPPVLVLAPIVLEAAPLVFVAAPPAAVAAPPVLGSAPFTPMVFDVLLSPQLIAKRVEQAQVYGSQKLVFFNDADARVTNSSKFAYLMLALRETNPQRLCLGVVPRLGLSQPIVQQDLSG